MSKKKLRKVFKGKSPLKAFWVANTLLGVYVCAMGCRIPIFICITAVLLVGSVFIIGKPKWFKKKKKAQKKASVGDMKQRRSILKGIVTVVQYMVLCIVLFEFSMYSVLVTQVQAAGYGYLVVKDVRINAEGTGLSLLTSSVKGDKLGLFTFDGWLLGEKWVK